MTALFGGCAPDWQARQVPVPEPGPDQVLVRAHAVSVNNADIRMLLSADDPATGHGNAYRAGYEFAGVIAAVGPEVDDIRVGERVVGTAPES
jgi:NADPH:quinone reductase